MAEIRFEWNPSKSATNRRKHGVSFEEASTVFTDEHAVLIDDPEHSEGEDRFILLGLSSSLRIHRETDELIRIISARKATRKERDFYNRRWSV